MVGLMELQIHQERQRILLAIPDAYLAAEYEATLRDSGFDAATAADGLRCLEEIKVVTPDLVVLDADILWGGADGVLAVLADDPAYPAVPSMVVSSRRSRAALYQVGRFIVSDYQLKPLSAARLVRRIGKLLQRTGHFTGDRWDS